MRLYFDMNIYNRVFDDQNQYRVRLETTAALSLCAVISNCDYFLTCDDSFIKTINRNITTLKPDIKSIKLSNPVDFLRKETSLDDNK